MSLQWKKRPHHRWPIYTLAMALTKAIYRATAQLPAEEGYGLQSQMRRSAVSIVSNIAEGAARGSSRELRRFLYNARGSMAELEAQIELCLELELLSAPRLTEAVDVINNLQPALQAFLNTLNKKLAS